MVGIGGGVSSAESDIRLGDVVISQLHMQHGGVVQYDFGKTVNEAIEGNDGKSSLYDLLCKTHSIYPFLVVKRYLPY